MEPHKALETIIDYSLNESSDARILNKKKETNTVLTTTALISTGVLTITSLIQTPPETYTFLNTSTLVAGIGGAYAFAANRLRGPKLTKKGPYSVHRNPEYIGEIICAAGATSMLMEPLLAGNHYLAIGSAISTLLLFARGRHLRVLGEEKVFEHKNYAEFNQYKKNTPKYFPKITNLFKQTKP